MKFGEMNLVESIFEEKPVQWGLRGDPYMWKELKKSLSGFTEHLNQIEFETELEKQFYDFIAREGKRKSNDTVWFKSFPQLGMSGGSISLTWWQEIGLPLIKSKYKELDT